MKAYLPLILILLVVVGSIVWIFINDSPPSITNPKYTVGTITSLKQGQSSSGLNAIVKFIINGKEYEKWIGSSKYESNVIGEKYMVVYESKKPEQNIVLTYQPIFNKEEVTKETKGMITRLFRFSWNKNEYIPNYGIEFEYEANGEKFTKSQSLLKDFKKKYPNLKEGNTYLVRYWVKNPQRAIIYLNQPKKEY